MLVHTPLAIFLCLFIRAAFMIRLMLMIHIRCPCRPRHTMLLSPIRHQDAMMSRHYAAFALFDTLLFWGWL